MQLGDRGHARQEIQALQLLRDELLQSKNDYWAETAGNPAQAAGAWSPSWKAIRPRRLALMRSAADLEDASDKHIAMENRLWPMA